jgi:peptidoglycan/xylan/chitin deacetylase (PgdA/CDA1 family)
VSHPILARTHDAQSRAEILDSWSRLRAEAAHPVPVFSYPNGLEPDFGEREYRYLEEAGLEGAVTGIPGFASPAAYGAPHGRFRIPRLGYPDDFEVLVQYVSGLERLKEVLRGGP